MCGSIIKKQVSIQGKIMPVILIIAITWIFVVGLMALTEPSVVGGIMTFLGYCVLPLSILYYLAGSKRRRTRAARTNASSEDGFTPAYFAGDAGAANWNSAADDAPRRADSGDECKAESSTESRSDSSADSGSDCGSNSGSDNSSDSGSDSSSDSGSSSD
jgi:hypothetical protein